MGKKRKSIFSSFLMVAVSMALLLFSPVKAQAAELDEDYYKNLASYILTACVNTSDESYESIKTMRTTQLDYALLQSGIPCEGTNYIKVLKSYRDGLEECGALENAEDTAGIIDSFELKQRGHEVQLAGVVAFADREADMTFMFEDDGTLTGLSIGGKYTTNEIMRKAVQNTIIGMGVVFCVLIFMSWVISGFKIVYNIQNKVGQGKDKNNEGNGQKTDTVIRSVKGPDDNEIDDETLAIITAVIEQEANRTSVRARENKLMRTYNVTISGKTYQVEVEEVGARKSHIRPASAPVQAAPVQPASPAQAAAPSAPVQAAPAQAAAPAQPAAPAKPAAQPAAASAGSKTVSSGVAGKVYTIEASVGQAVKAGDPVLILEAMKMEIPVVAPADGTIASISVSVGDTVDVGQVLATLN